MRPFADDGSDGWGLPWLSAGPLLTAAVVLLVLLQTEATDRERRLTAVSERARKQVAPLTIYRHGAHDFDIGDQHA